jgi:uncharacterized protein with von Willebrand factor type A (vWA) domain
MSSILPNLLHFGRLLRSLGLDVQAGRMIEVASALEHVDLGRRTDFYFTLRSLLVHRQQDLALFDEAFRVFWRRPPGEWSSEDLRALGERRRLGPPQKDAPAVEPGSSGDRSPPTQADETIDGIAPMSYSSREVSRVKDFARFTEEELKQAKAMIAAFRWDLGRRQTRRWAPGRSGIPDLRRVVRRNFRYGGEPLTIPTRHRTSKRRPLVLLCDVSGSMERYARMLLHFIHSLTRSLDRVEAFLFATRLTRITREIARRGVDDAVPKIQGRMPDWAGGTRIGEALRTFNVRWARRVLGHGPIVLLISDGWDRGDPDLLQREMGRLQRSCHRLIWLNPLLGSAAYQPLTRGMQAALPFIDDFLPVHNLASLEGLAEHLNRLPARRAARRGRAATGSIRPSAADTQKTCPSSFSTPSQGDAGQPSR